MVSVESLMRRCKVNQETGCWEWTSARQKNGYGRVCSRIGQSMSRTRLAHRIAYLVFVGPIPDGKCVLHRCDVRHCINPDHLFIGTQQDNLQDMTNKNRRAKGDCSGIRKHPERYPRGSNHWTVVNPSNVPRGEKQPHSKLTCDKVSEIRQRYASGSETLYSLAKEFGVRHGTIEKVVKRLRWKHVQ